MATVYELKKQNKPKKKRRLLKAAGSVLLLAFISVAAAILVTNNGKLSIEGIGRLFSGKGSEMEAAVFSFDAGAGSVFADLNGGLAVGAGSGLQVFDAGANKMFGEAFEMKSPAISTNGDVSAIYDIGGKTLKLFDLYGVTKSISTEGKIISASINKSGWLALCTQETGGIKGRVTVYNKNKSEAFYWDSAKGYILSAAVSPDNKSLAVLTLNDEGSRIVFFSLNSPDEKGACTLPGEIALDIRYLGDGRVLAINSGALGIVKPDGSADILIDYADQYLKGYSVDGDGFTALVLSDYMVGDQGSVLTVDQNGNVLGTMETSRKIVSISAKGEYLAVLYSDGLTIYDRNLKEYAHFDDTVGAEQTMMRQDGKAFLITSHSASVCSIPKD